MQLVEAQRSNPRVGLDIALPGTSPCEASAEWTVAGWKLQFMRLQPGKTASIDQSLGTVHVKVVTGCLAQPALQPFAPAGALRSIVVTEAEVTAGGQGALLAVMTETARVPDNLHSMEQLAFSGPHAEVFVWKTFFDQFRGAEMFAGLDAHIVPGFHLLDGDGTEMVYVNFWTMGKDGDASTHNHGRGPAPKAPAFAEIHFVFNNGTGAGGMYRCDEPGAERTTMVMQRGEEHGPMWDVDAATGMPARRENGAVSYGWHGWKAGIDGNEAQAYDFVVAFEINPELAPVGPQ